MKRAQSGVALVAAIFLIIVIGLALTLLANLAVRGSGQTTQSLLKTRAELATRSATEAVIQRLVTDSNDSWCDGSVFAVPVPVYSQFTVSANCQVNVYHRPSQPVRLYQITTTAEFGEPTSADYVWEQASSTVEL